MRAQRFWIWAIVVAVLTAPAALRAQTPVGTAFTYQGQLKQAGTPFDGLADFEFTLWDDPNSTDPNDLVAGPLVENNKEVDNGLFTVQLDFGENIFTGAARWLEISVNGTPLSPRQELTPTPHALALPGLWTQQNDISPNLIGGCSGNIAGPGVVGATIGGGGTDGAGNRVWDHYGAVGGGSGNQAGDDDGDPTDASIATVAGGMSNSGSSSGATVGGGMSNTADGSMAAVSGGKNNRASSYGAAVGGGISNTASGVYATVPGGSSNTAQGQYSLASGYRAEALHDGTFVWADSSGDGMSSTGRDQFLIRAGGGVGIGTSNPEAQLDVEGTVRTRGFWMPTGAAPGSVLTCDELGVGTWQPGLPMAWSLTGNSGTNPETNFLGTTDWRPLVLRVNGEQALRIEPASNEDYSVPNLIGGYSGNEAAPGVIGAVVGGGGHGPIPPLETYDFGNRVTGHFGTVGGGVDNQAGSDSGDPSDARFATVSGGTKNVAGGEHSVVGGGYNNSATGSHSVIGGGQANSADGLAATVPGGNLCAANGDWSFAAGRQAKANHEGAFVWADSTNANFGSTAGDQFLIRAGGGVGIGTTSPDEQLHVAGNVKADGTIFAGAFSSNSALELQTAGTTRIRVDDVSGNVGIGTDAPGSPLTVNGLIESTTDGFKFPDGTVQTTAAADGGIPTGAIIMWSGSLASIPEGWGLCDGTNGTPDLADRFILGVQAGENPGATGGSHQVTLTTSQMPSHTHAVSIDPAGGHTHIYRHQPVPIVIQDGDGFPYAVKMHHDEDYSTSHGGQHVHTATAQSTGGGQPFDNRPRYYKLAFIMKL